MRRRAGGTVVATLLLVATTGCISPAALGHMHALKASDLLDPAIGGNQVVDAVQTAQRAGAALAAIFALIAALGCAHKAREGEGGWTKLMGGYLTGIFWAAALIGTWGSSIGADVLIRGAGDELAEAFKAAGGTWDSYFHLADQSAQAIMTLDVEVGKGDVAGTNGSSSTPTPAGLGPSVGTPRVGPVAVGDSSSSQPGEWDIASGVASFYSRGVALPLLALNGTAAYIQEILLQSIGAWLVVLYTIVGPMAAACLVLPATRSIFWGWIRAMCSLALWGALFGIAERITQTVPAALARGIVDAGATCGLTAGCGLLELAEASMAYTISLALTNIVLITIYLSVPVAAWMLVNAAGRPFKGAF